MVMAITRFNRYIVECKYDEMIRQPAGTVDLIDT